MQTNIYKTSLTNQVMQTKFPNWIAFEFKSQLRSKKIEEQSIEIYTQFEISRNEKFDYPLETLTNIANQKNQVEIVNTIEM